MKDDMSGMKSLAENPGKLEVGLGKEPYYSKVTLTEKVMPELKGYKIKDKILLLCEVEVCSISKYGNGDIEYRLELRKGKIKE